jgi:hypothetical protein
MILPDRVVPIKIESVSTGGTQEDQEYLPAESNDALEARGYYIQNDTSNDTEVLISRDSLNNMTFQDPETGPCTLSQLLNSGGSSFSPNSMILDKDGKLVYIEDGDILLKLP